MSAAMSSELVKLAPERFAFARNAPVKLTSLRSAFLKVESVKFAPSMFDSLRVA